jgi:hypothetical protein
MKSVRKPAILLFLILLNHVTGLASAAELTTDTAVASAGFYRLSWRSEEPVRLVESQSNDFRDARVVYSGDDTASVFSGKPDGTWYYRLEARETHEPLSDTLSVVVKHHSLQRAWAFFGVGASVFFATLGLIVFGHRRSGSSGNRIKSR